MTYTELLHQQFTLAQIGELLFRIVIACLCGAGIGLERSRRLKEAGIRTHLIVCLASALMMIVSKYGFADLATADTITILGTKGADPARIAAQVVSGVSFIGAGVIFHNKNSVKGLTTAAGLWATAGIGLTLGSGMYILGIATTCIIMVLQFVLHRVAGGTDNVSIVQLSFTAAEDVDVCKQMQDYLIKHNMELIESEIVGAKEGGTTYTLKLRAHKNLTMEDLHDIMKDNSGLKSIKCMTSN